MNQTIKKILVVLLAGIMMLGACACGTSSEKQVVFYTNADDEAVEAMKEALDSNGYEGKYILQTFGTSELGGKLLAEGTNIEADLITMSSYYIQSAQEQNNMFADLTFDRTPLKEYPAYQAPTTSQEGAIIVNTTALAESGLPMPQSFQDLAKPEYAGQVSVPDVNASSTAWLMVQAILEAYGETEGKEIMAGIIQNAGPHYESSGSGPLKKVRAGEVAVAFGLRHQAVADKQDGLPIDYVDPAEGTYSLTESVAVIDKGDNTNPLAMEMAACIIQKGRSLLLETYPVPVYEGETANEEMISKNTKEFPEPLTVDLLEEHKKFVEECK